MFKKHFYDFIFDRVNECIKNLRKSNRSYRKKLNRYTKLYENLSNSFSKSDLAKLDELLYLLNEISCYELESIYIQAIKDTAELNDTNIFSKLF